MTGMRGFNDPSRHDRPFLGVARSVTGKGWRSRLDDAGEAAAAAIAQRHDIPDIVARVLAGRGVTTETAEAYLAPTIRNEMPDPSELADLDAAAARLADAVAAGEAITIFGDYDVDGATSAALLHDILAECGLDPRIYIPDRVFEGYGPNPEAIDRLIDEGASLIVTVDCGVTSFEALEAAQARGIDVVVIDHHQVGVSLPPATAIVNPNRQDDISGQGDLAAVGVTFFVAAGLIRLLRHRGFFDDTRPQPDLLAWLDLVAFGTVCDIVPLRGLNRAFVQKGLVAMRHTTRPGILALVMEAGLKEPVDTGHLGFLLGPRINAGGRIGDAALGARLLTTADEGEARDIAETLGRLNRERQAIERDAVDDAIAEAEAEIGEGEGPAAIVAARDGWHPGVAGLVASRLKDRFGRPAIAIAFVKDTDSGTGSGRSVSGIDLGAAVRKAVDTGILVKGGGHAMAAGLTIERSRLAEFRQYLETELGDAVRLARQSDGLSIDAAMTASGARLDLISDLKAAGPFGSGNPAPVFAFPAHRLRYAEVVGNGHVRVGLSADTGSTLKGIAFRAAGTPLGDVLLSAGGRPLHVAGTLSVDHWGGSPRPQLRVIDAAIPDGRI
jgi:single-stranded-DNA-specific exonuclease